MNNNNFFGTTYTTKKGYSMISSTKEGNAGKLLHRLIWENHHNKKIPNDYIIHHIDHNKKNNNIQNLQCVKKSIHSTYHIKGSKNPNYSNNLFKYPGARLFKNRNPEKKCWNSTIKIKQKRKSLGMYEDPLSANIVYSLVLQEVF